MRILRTVSLDGNGLETPCAGDLFAQEALLPVGEALPEGWRVLTGNNDHSTIARVVMRCELEDQPQRPGMGEENYKCQD